MRQISVKGVTGVTRGARRVSKDLASQSVRPSLRTKTRERETLFSNQREGDGPSVCLTDNSVITCVRKPPFF